MFHERWERDLFEKKVLGFDPRIFALNGFVHNLTIEGNLIVVDESGELLFKEWDEVLRHLSGQVQVFKELFFAGFHHSTIIEYQ